MQKEITHKVWCCDVCGRQQGFIGTCQVCGKEHCSICEFIGYNPTNIDICKDHQNDSDMKETLQSFDKRFSALKAEMLAKIIKVTICTNLESNNEKTKQNTKDVKTDIS